MTGREPGWLDAQGGPTALVVDADAVVELAQQLVRIRSVHQPDQGSGEAEAAALVAATMRGFGWDPEVVEVSPGRPNVIATVLGGGGPGPVLAFEGHLDVVTEGDPGDWTVGPYDGEIRDGRLYGRGAADMKAGVAAMIHATRALQMAGPFPGAIRLLALADEEGMMLGAKHAVASGALADVAGVIVCEPEGGEVCPTSKGAIRIRVDLSGKMAHGAMPHQGANPIPVLAELIQDLGRLQDRLQAEVGEHPHLGWTYVTPTVALAGRLEQLNVSPATATLAVDVRTVPGTDHRRLIEEVADACRRLGAKAGVGCELTVLDDRPAVDTPVDDPVVASLVAAHTEVTGAPPIYGGVPGTTDGTIFTRDAGVATVVYGPGGKWIAHQADEFVEVDEIPQYARVYARAAQIFFQRDQVPA
ncbi:MAG: M20 family metallopeptidase [Candidatus Dormibacteria bacterium]